MTDLRRHRLVALVPAELMEVETFPALAKLLSGSVCVRAEHHWDSNLIAMTLIAPSFPEVPDGNATPEVCVTMDPDGMLGFST